MVMMMVSNFPARAGGTSHFLPRDQISHLQPRIDANHALRLITSRFSNDKFINLSYNKSTIILGTMGKIRHHCSLSLTIIQRMDEHYSDDQ